MAAGAALAGGGLSILAAIIRSIREKKKKQQDKDLVFEKLKYMSDLDEQKEQRKLSREDQARLAIGEALKGSFAKNNPDMTPQALGYLAQNNLLDDYLKQSAQGEKEKKIAEFLNNPNLDDNTKNALMYKFYSGEDGSSAFKLPSEIEKNKSQTRKYDANTEEIQRLLGLKAEEKRASINSKKASTSNSYASAERTRSRMQYDNPELYETVTEVDGQGNSVKSQRKKGQVANRPMAEDPLLAPVIVNYTPRS